MAKLNSEEKLLYAALGSKFNMFLERCFKEIDGGEKYVETIAKELLVDNLQAIMCGDIKRFIANLPPRTFKTFIITIAWTAWLLGQNPKLKIMCISYSDDVAKEFSVKVRQIMKSDWYKKTFPKTRLKFWGQKDDYLETTQNGFRRSVSLGGSITGYGADIIIIDDPQKAQEILSEKKRRKSNEIFSSTIISRLNNKVEGKIIVAAQRLHMDDFSNYVQKFGKWKVLAVPAIAETDESYTLSDGRVITRKAGEAINPVLEPLDKLEEIREGLGDFNFSAQYQQNPIPEKGSIIDVDTFQTYSSLPPAPDALIIQSWDVAMNTGENHDYSVCITAKVVDIVAYIIDISCYKYEFPDLLARVKIMQTKYNAKRIIIEDAPISIPLIQQLRKDGMFINTYHPTIDKKIRAAACTHLIRSGNVRLPEAAPWLDCFKSEVRAFPFGTHNDQVDALVQLLDELERVQHDCSIIGIADAMKRYRQKQQTPQQLTNRTMVDLAMKQHKFNLSNKIPRLL